MTDTNTGTEPVAVERGRYALFGDGSPTGWVVARAIGLCDRCQSCGCGTQQETISTGAMLKDMMGNPLQMMRGLRQLVGGRADGDASHASHADVPGETSDG